MTSDRECALQGLEFQPPWGCQAKRFPWRLVLLVPFFFFFNIFSLVQCIIGYRKRILEIRSDRIQSAGPCPLRRPAFFWSVSVSAALRLFPNASAPRKKSVAVLCVASLLNSGLINAKIYSRLTRGHGFPSGTVFRSSMLTILTWPDVACPFWCNL